jgi:hypothetical protein
LRPGIFFPTALNSPCPKDLSLGMAKSKASSLSSAEVRRLWEEPAEETGLTSGSVGILAIYGGEDVNRSTCHPEDIR